MKTYDVYHCTDHDPQLQLWLQPGETVIKREHYVKVAEVRAETLEEVFVLTNTIDHDWQENANVFGVRPDEPKRSTSVGDVIVEGKQTWLVDRVGYVEIDATGWQSTAEPSLSQHLRWFCRRTGTLSFEARRAFRRLLASCGIHERKAAREYVETGDHLSDAQGDVCHPDTR